MKLHIPSIDSLVRPVLGRPARMDLRGRTALVTGAAQGIGFATARNLVGRGARVVLVDVDRSLLDQAAGSLGVENAVGVEADVRDRAAMAEAVARAVAHFGRLDIVVANAGVTPVPATIRSMDLDDFDRVMAINAVGVVNTLKPALDQVIRHGGHVTVVSSVAAFAPGVGAAAYGASKAAVEQIGRALRIELGITEATAGVAYFGVVDTALVHQAFDADPLGREVNAMLPLPMRRRIRPEEAAQVLVQGIENRAPRTIAPKSWEPYLLMREVVNRTLDDRLRTSRTIQDLMRAIENRLDSANR